MQHIYYHICAYILHIAVVFQGDRATLVYNPVKMLCQYVRSLVPLHWCLRPPPSSPMSRNGTAHKHLFHTRQSCDARNLQMLHNSKIQYFIEPFLIRSVRCKMRVFLTLYNSWVMYSGIEVMYTNPIPKSWDTVQIVNKNRMQ